MKALLPEPSSPAQEAIRDILSERGWNVFCGAPGVTPWDCFHSTPAPLVVLDFLHGGVEACRRIRALSGGAHAQILFIVPPHPDACCGLLAAEGDDYITTPINPADANVRIGMIERRLTKPPNRAALDRVREQLRELREAIQLQRAFYEELFERAPEGIAVVDRDEVVLRVNSEFCHMFGYTPDEAVGRPINDLIAGGTVRAQAAAASERLRRGERLVQETIRTRRDGTPVEVSLLAIPVRVGGGQVGAYGIYRDISDRKQTERALRRREHELRTLVEHAPDVIFRFDHDFRIVHVNPAVEVATGLPPVAFLGNRLEDLRPPPPVIDAWRPALEHVFTHGESREFEFMYGAPDGDRFFDVRLIPEWGVHGGEGTAVAFVRDLSNRRRAEQQLRESELRLRLLIGQIPAIVWTTDDQLVFTSSDGAGLAALEQAANEVVGQSVAQYFATEDPEFPPVAAHHRALDGERTSFEITWRGRFFNGMVEPLRGPGGEIRGVVGVALDVTVRRQTESALHQSEERYRALFDQSPVGVFQCDPAFRITVCNQRLLKILQAPEERVVGTKLTKLRDPRVQAVIRQALTSRFESGTIRYEGPYEPMSGGPDVWISALVAPLRNGAGAIIGGIGVVEDITHRYRTEEQLRKQAEELENINERLVQQTQALQAAMEARSHFYARVSHELRTPISAIMLYNDLLIGGAMGDVLMPEQQSGVERSQEAAQHLLDVVQDVLDLSRVEAGKITLELRSVGVSEVIDELLPTVLPLAEQRGSELRIEREDEGGSLVTDPRRLRQILLNLLSNALKFGRARPVTLRCKAVPDRLAFEVADEGVGIAPEDLQRIFEDFVQIGTPTEGGAGLGLAISRRLAELLGGRLEVESTPELGSTFRLTLPRTPPPSIVARTGAGR